MQCKLAHHQDCKDGEKSPKHRRLVLVPALCLHPHTQNTAQISWHYLQGKCGGSSPGKPGRGMKDTPSQGSQQWGTHNQCCIISSNCTVWHKARICGCLQWCLWPLLPLLFLAPLPPVSGAWQKELCIPLQYSTTTAGQFWNPYWNWNEAGKSVIVQQLQLAKISSLCPWMVRPTSAVQWHLFSPDS